jgi:hypothetical protein
VACRQTGSRRWLLAAATVPLVLRLDRLLSVDPVVRKGFEDAPPRERAAFGMLSSCALAIAVARAVTNVRERRRTAPRLRGLTRRAYHAPGANEMRVHHFVPGMLVSAVAGAAAILTRKDGQEFWLSLPFGVGTGLTLDELALLVELDDPYWSSERVTLIEGAGAGLAAIALLARFYRRGRDSSRDDETPEAARLRE